MLPESCWDRNHWDFLLLVDSREASRVRKAGCRHCGGGVHIPHGVMQIQW